jgi:ABC-type transport system substrate-binding protein
VNRALGAPLIVLLLGALLAGGCGSGSGQSATGQSLIYHYLPVDQVDPQRISDGEGFAGENLLEGLVTPNATGTGVVPATADSWQVSRGGTVYTFHIRKDARWSDGTPVTASDFEWTYRRLLKPSTSSTGGNLNGESSYSDLGIKNAVAFQLGQATAWSKVGVKALDASHLRIVLAAPNTAFLQGMAEPPMVALPEKNLTRHPFDWQTSAHWVGNGPFIMRSFTPNSRMVLVPNPHYWDRRAVHLTRLTVTMAPATEEQLRRQYVQRKVDVALLADPQAFASDPAVAHAVTSLPEFSVQFLNLIPSRNPALEDVRVRKAIAFAIDRAAVAKVSPVIKPSTSLVPDTLPGFDAGVGFRPNLAEARRLLAEAGYPSGKGFPTFIVMTYGFDPFIQVVLRSLHRELGIRAVQDVEDPTVYDARRFEVLPASRVGYFFNGYSAILDWRDWVSHLYPPSQTELLSLRPDDYTHYQVLQARGTATSVAAATAFLDAHASPQSKRFAAVTAVADRTADATLSTELYKRAAAIRQGTYEFIPFAYRSLTFAIRPGAKGIHLRTGSLMISFKGVRVG